MSELRDDLPPRELAELRLQAEQFLRDKNDQPLLDLVDDLRGDEQWWAHLWGPGAALAAHRLGSPQASVLLAEVVAAGFSQPELFDGDLEEAFGADPEWPGLQRRMQGNISQVLNAVRIPSRRLELRQANHHVGVGRGHVVSEAWIDDLDRWVLLDGQNGSYWVGADGQPLGVRELQQLTEPPAFVGARGVESLSTAEAASWFSYFASATTTGYTWSEGPFAPVFQGIGIIRTPRLIHDGDLAYPRLSALTTGLGGTLDAPTVRFTHSHPYGTGVAVNGEVVDEYALDLTPGTHELAVTIATPYGETAPQRLRYLVRG